jgi:hypothetical protein
VTSQDVVAPLGFFEREALAHARPVAPIRVDMRTPRVDVGELTGERVECRIRDARPTADEFTLDTSGFTLVHRPSGVRDWYDSTEVTRVYYEECRQLARDMTGASHAFTFDHIIREPGRQIGGGGTAGQDVITTAERGGGYISGVHMDYTDSSTWDEYLALHGHAVPIAARRVIVLNFWRPLFNPPDRAPLALCDARTVQPDDLLETMLYGYGHEGYSWHDIGISVYQVASSPAQRWYWFSNMTPEEVLLIKTYDSEGVVGRACPHAAFDNPVVPDATPDRRSIELRVLCFLDTTDRLGPNV